MISQYIVEDPEDPPALVLLHGTTEIDIAALLDVVRNTGARLVSERYASRVNAP